MTKYIVFTDGSCRNNKNGGIGIIWVKNGVKVLEYSKGFKNVTNNLMELYAIYIVLKSLKREIDSLEIISDSKYSIGIITNPTWKPKKNLNLVEKIKEQLKEAQKLVKNPIKWTHVRGHQSNDEEYNKYNNMADKLAQSASLDII